jgi:predicted Ser/Thr protein kinase
LIGVGRVEPLADDPHGTMETTPVPYVQVVAPKAAVDEVQPVSDQTAVLVATDLHPHDTPRTQQELAEAALDATHVNPLGDVIATPGDSDITGEMQLTPTPSGVVHARESSTRPRPTLEPGTIVGRYRLEEKLGQGGMGVVFRATDLSDDAQVAIKILWSSGMDSMQAIRRFQKEARLLAGVQNDFVTRLHEVGEDNGLYFLAMEYVQGTTLKHWLAESGPIDERTSLILISDIARGLLEAHAKGIVHRDIKPENVLLQNLDPASNDLLTKRVKLSDFGIARQVEQSVSMEVTQAGALLGTPRYMSPEQCRGSKEIGPQADVYSLGITLYELLAGAPPYSARCTATCRNALL